MNLPMGEYVEEKALGSRLNPKGHCRLQRTGYPQSRLEARREGSGPGTEMEGIPEVKGRNCF